MLRLSANLLFNQDGGNKMNEHIYSAVFLVNPMLVGDEQRWQLSKFHITYHYNPGNPRICDNYHEGDWITIKHRGIYDDGEILASRVDLVKRDGSVLSRQRQSNAPLHITWDSGELPPVQSGIRLADPGLCEDFYHSFDIVNEAYHEFGDDTMKREKYHRIMERMNTVGMWNYYRSNGS